MARIFISTGEVSGDLQGSLLVNALKRQAIAQGLDLEILALGGERMREAGATLLGDTTRISAMGLVESVPYILPTLRLQQQAKAYLRQYPPDLLVLIDYIGPNLSVGRFVRQFLPHVPIIYYIAPQAWVWSPNARDIQQLIGIIDHLLAIFPDEAGFFEEKGVAVTWVGHPLLDRLQDAPSRQQARELFGIAPDERVITLLPASRQQELKYLFPVMCEAVRQIQAKLPGVRLLLPLSLPAYRPKIEAILAQYGLTATLLEVQTLEAITAADLAITKSGTANLEIALLQVPQVVLYRLNPLTMWIARRLLKFSIPFMSPVNLVAGREIVPELLQEAATPEAIVQASLDFLLNPQRQELLQRDYQLMRANLGEVGVCDRAAQKILRMLPSG